VIETDEITADAASPLPDSGGTGTLYLVATPIGNLEDITARALRILREADLIAAEDTRVTRKLLSRFDIHTPLTSYHAHSSEGRSDALLARLRAGASIALVSDAGTPAISDPGADLVAAAVDGGIRVEPIPGPCAMVAALVASGLPTDRFVFEGFLPRGKAEYREKLATIVQETRTVILYEAPSRLVETLKDLANAMGDQRRVCVAREITKRFEEFRRGTAASVAAHYEATPPRGECVIVIQGGDGSAGADAPAEAGPEALLQAALDRGLTPRDAAREVARTTGRARNELYALVLTLEKSAS
jgi:16S rRNA (cytidine1402-2'-O)-methyltransferase